MNIILNAIQKWAKTHPNHIAFVGVHEGQRVEMTYSELISQIEHVAKQLKAQDIKALALRAENSIHWAVVDLAAMSADVVVVPIPTFFSDAQVLHTLEQSCVDALVGDWQTWLTAHTEQNKITSPSSLSIAHLPLLRRQSVGQKAYLAGTGKITFTSGSTGQPKGVCLSYEHLGNVAQSLALTVQGHAQSHFVLLPLSTLLENITGLYVPLLLGVTSSILPAEQTGLLGSNQFDPHRFASALATIKPESLVLTPALLLALIQIAKQQPNLTKSLSFIAVGGARVSEQLIKAAQALDLPVFEGYGLSECGSVVCLNTPSDFKIGTCGKPLPHTKVRLAQDGELLVKGNTALGYLNEPFTQQWLATGDLAQIDEQGFVSLLGRKKNLVITLYGRNVSPEWIESEAMAFLPTVPLIVTGDHQQALCAVAKRHKNIEHEIAKLNSTLPDYAQIRTLLLLDNPAAISAWFTDNGKPKRQNIEQDVEHLLKRKTNNFTWERQNIQRVEVPVCHTHAHFQTAS
ncbi:AMP-binding protein [Vibrio zhanjiangensis]|nr:AMP-binding protein [Vibrio zhanjiangensis]